MGVARPQPWWQRVNVTTSAAGRVQVEIRCAGFHFGDGTSAELCAWLEKSLHLASGHRVAWLDFRSTSLGDMGIDHLAKSLGVLKMEVERLWLSSAALTPSCLASLQRLAATASLQEMHLEGNNFDDEAAYLLLHAVADARKSVSRPAWVLMSGNAIHDPAAVVERLRQAGVPVNLQGCSLALKNKSSDPVAAKLVVPGLCDQPLAPGGAKDCGNPEQGTDDAQRLVEALGVLTEALSLGDNEGPEGEEEPSTAQVSDPAVAPAAAPEDGADWDPYMFVSPVYGEVDDSSNRAAPGSPLSPEPPSLQSPVLRPMAPPAATTSPAAPGGASRVAAARPAGVLGGEVAGALAALRGLLSVHNAASTSAVTSAVAAPQVVPHEAPQVYLQAAPAPQVALQTTPQAVHQTAPHAALQSAPWRRPSPEERLASLVADNALIGPPGQPGGLPPLTSGLPMSQPGNTHAGVGTLDMSTNYVLSGTQSFLHSLSGEMQAQLQMHPAIPGGQMQLQPQSSLDTLGLSTVNPGMHGAQPPPMQPQALPPIQHTLLAPVAYQQGAGQVPPQAPNYGSVFSMQGGAGQPPQATGMSSIEIPVSAFQASLAEQARLQTSWPPAPPAVTAAPGPLAHPSAPERPHDPRVAPMQPQPLAPLAPAAEHRRLAQYEAALFGNLPVVDGKRPAEALPDNASAPWNSRRRLGDGPH